MSTSGTGRSVTIHFDHDFALFLFKAAAFLLLLLALAWILPYSRLVLIPLILAFILSVLLNPLVVLLERWGLGRTVAVIFVLAALALLLAVLLKLLAPVIAKEFKTLSSHFQNETPASLLERWKNQLYHQLPWLKSSAFAIELMNRAEKLFYSLLDKSYQVLPNIIPALIGLVLIPIMTFFLLRDGRTLKKSFIQALPNRYFEMTVSLLHKIDRQLGSYIRGQMLVSLCIGSLAVAALAVLEVPYFLLIGCAAGLANMIPYFGPIVGAIPAVILGVISRGTMKAALPIIAAFLLIRLIDDTLVSPNILGRSLKIHPLLVILAIFIGGEMFGIMGLLLCIPVTGIIKVTIQELAWNFRHYRALRSGG